MITNFNDTKTQGDYIDIKKYIGVGTIKIMSVNPTNAVLRKYGWTIPDGADEPSYVSVDKEGKKSARVRFLVQIQELDDKPIVALDFWIRPEFRTSTSSGELKVQVIDNFGRTAFLSKSEYDSKTVPTFSDGRAKVSKNYRMAKSGEADLIKFLMVFLNCTPFEMYDKNANKYVATKAPGELTIDNWNKLCDGDMKEIAGYVGLKPENQMKIDFGIRTTQENKSYQTFLPSAFFSNNIYLDPSTNKYNKVQKEIDNYTSFHNSSDVTLQFDAAPVREWTVSASDVADNSGADMPDFTQKTDFSDPSFFKDDPNDLPFGD